MCVKTGDFSTMAHHRGHLHERFGPARSPDLTPLDLLCRNMKSLVYEIPVDSEEDLLARVLAAEGAGLQGIGDGVYQNVVRRYRVCVEVAGRHFEPLF